MFTLQMYTDLSVLPKVVETNIDEIAPIIAEKLEKVDGLIVDETGLAAAKSDAAELRKMAKGIATFRKDHISIWKTPMEVFESKCKEFEKKLDSAADELTAKVNHIVYQRKAEKKVRMRALMQKALAEKFPEESMRPVRESPFWAGWFDNWTDTKQKGCWLNSTIADEFAYNSTITEADRVLVDFAAIRDNYADKDRETKQKAFLTFAASLDLKPTIQIMRAWTIERDALASARAADAAAKAAQIASAPAPEPKPVQQPQPAQPPAQPEPPTQQPKPVEDAPVRSWKCTISGTFEAVKLVGKFAREHGVTIAIAK